MNQEAAAPSKEQEVPMDEVLRRMLNTPPQPKTGTQAPVDKKPA